MKDGQSVVDEARRALLNNHSVVLADRRSLHFIRRNAMKRLRRRRQRLSACQFQDRGWPVGRLQLAPQRPLVSRPTTGRRAVRPYYVRDQSRNDFVPTHLTIHLRAGLSRGSDPPVHRPSLLIYDRLVCYQPFSGVQYLLVLV